MGVLSMQGSAENKHTSVTASFNTIKVFRKSWANHSDGELSFMTRI